MLLLRPAAAHGGLKALLGTGSDAKAAPCCASPLPHRLAVCTSGGSWRRAAAAPDADAEAARLSTAATILSASASDDEGLPLLSSSLDEDAASLPGGTSGSGSARSSSDLGHSRLSALGELVELDADGLSLVVGILRQRDEPLDEGTEAGVALSERLRDLLVLLRSRPGSPPPSQHAGVALPAWAPGPQQQHHHQQQQAPSELQDEDDSFWSAPDEWADVRAALMSIGINASLDEEDEEESVWAPEAGLLARRTRLLQRLPKLDAHTAAELTSFLAELQQRHATGSSSDGAGGSSSSTAEPDRPALSEEELLREERWWEQTTQAYELLWQQAKVQQAALQQDAGTQ